MGINEFIAIQKDKIGHRNYSDMAKVIGVPADFLLRLSKTESKEEMKQINVENLERVAKYFCITIDELINAKILNTQEINDCNTHFINDECTDMNILLNELIYKVNNEGIRFNGIEMNKESKQIFIDSLDVVKKLVESKL